MHFFKLVMLSECLDSRFSLTFAFFFFFFFFLACMNSERTWIHYARDKVHYSCIVHRSHVTIHTFKNYFAIVFSVFSK